MEFNPLIRNIIGNLAGPVVKKGSGGGTVNPPVKDKALLWSPDYLATDTERRDKIGSNTREVQPGRAYYFSTGDYLEIKKLTGSETVVSQGGSATITISAGKIECAAGDYLWDLVLSDGSSWHCAEGAGGVCYDAGGIHTPGCIHASDINSFHHTFTTATGSDVCNQVGYSKRLYGTKIAGDWQVTGDTPATVSAYFADSNCVFGEYYAAGISLYDAWYDNDSSVVIPKSELPSNIGVYCEDIDSLTDITIANSYLSGSWPHGIEKVCKNLEVIILVHNHFTGTYPTFESDTLWCIYTAYNDFDTAQLPAYFDGLPELWYYWSTHNNLTGPIPDITINKELHYFGSNDNNHTGSLPDFSACPSLACFQVNNSNYTGSIPELAGSVLECIWIVGNNFTDYAGTEIPSSMTQFKASGNALSQNAVDAILVQLNANETTGGLCELAGGTNAAPSSVGLAAKNELINDKSWTVNTN